ncbi:hypothetical protein CTAM01_08433 [Colletotrichum tamarilloi]|uniref:Clr5 domain-containing protein n=1 Tax=Colletotrichum tamarilloi TaxID=1209934 RepID=A0ABQ9R6C6_9PEZI|nr:uncharacterized protein CTAM01_08433 [Colletotrichum tamarilloi]KAK1496246.1 hypothetical protein CTAM01_08433 [Colletotrichum tamarilloi]
MPNSCGNMKLLAMTPPKKRAQMSEWQKFKPVIQQMILQKNKSLQETRQWLEEHGLPVTKAQLEYKIKVWGFRKKVPKNKSQAVWQYIGHQLAKRERLGKRTEVVLEKEVLDVAKVLAASPKPPEGIDICIGTPPPIRMEFEWPSSLPWIQSQPKLAQLFSATTVKDENAIAAPQTCMMSQALSSLLGDRNNASMEGVSQLAAEIGCIMPESHSQENMERAKKIIKGSTEESWPEYMKLVLFRLSNNLFDAQEVNNWTLILDSLERSGIMKSPLQLVRIADLTISAIAENLFRYGFDALWSLELTVELETRTTKLITWLLSSGENPNTPVRVVSTTGSVLLTPLQLAVQCEKPALAIQLLDAGADPNLAFDPSQPTPLMSVLEHYGGFEEDSYDLFRHLLNENASSNESPGSQGPSALMLAVEHSQLTLIDIDLLVQSGGSILHQIETPKSSRLSIFINSQSVIGCAAGLSSEWEALGRVEYLLKQVQRLYPSRSLASLIAPDVPLAAASRGHGKILRLLHEIGFNILNTWCNGISALHVAAYWGLADTCRLLLESGASVEGGGSLDQTPSPLYLAIFSNCYDTVQVLINTKADVHRGLALHEGHEGWGEKLWHPHWKPEQRSWTEFSSFFHSPIGAAILRAQDHRICDYLISQGVFVPEWAFYYGSCNPKSLLIVQLAAISMDSADPNWRGEDGRTPLQAALTVDDTSDSTQTLESQEIASILLHKGARFAGWEAQQAILLGRWELLDKILRLDTLGVAQRPQPMSMLEVALLTDSLQLFENCMETDRNKYDAGALCASVLLSIQNEDLDVTRRLLKHRDRRQIASLLEGSAIAIAAWFDWAELLDLLLTEIQPSPALARLPRRLDPNTDIDWVQYNILRLKTSIRDAVAGTLIDGLPFWHQDDGFDLVASPLVMALWSMESISQLLQHGHQPDKLTVSIAIKMGDLNLLQKLLRSNRLGKDCFDDKSEGLMLTAVSSKSIETVQILFNAGGDVNEKNDAMWFGRTPLQRAVEDGNLVMIDFLLKLDASVDAPAARTGGATALQIAAINGKLGLAKKLIDLGANVNAPGACYEGGRTALEGAAENGRIDMLKFLLLQGTDTTGKGRLHYLRAIKLALAEGHQVAAKLLKDTIEWEPEDEALLAKLDSLPRSQWERYCETADPRSVLGIASSSNEDLWVMSPALYP